jgi:hypothetical protein
MESLSSSEPKSVVGKKKTKYEFAGVGALVQLVGLVALWFFPIGTFVGVVLLIIGSAMSKKILCGECGNKVDKDSKMCPHCKVEFAK